jgi:hypothetical protein
VVSVDGSEEHELAGSTPPPLKNDRFTSDLYRRLLDAVLEREFRVHPIRGLTDPEVIGGCKVLLLRHDVDLSTRYAARMAEEEAKRGITATYFFLIAGAYYNILHPECRSELLAIRDMGHEIGLHYDDPRTLRKDCEILSALADTPVKSISQHNPTVEGLKQVEDMSLINAYDACITEEHGFTYVSDSGMKWRTPDVFQVLDRERVYLLTHPETWWSEGCDLIQLHRRIQQFEINKLKRLYNGYVAENIEYLTKRAGDEA